MCTHCQWWYLCETLSDVLFQTLFVDNHYTHSEKNPWQGMFQNAVRNLQTHFHRVLSIRLEISSHMQITLPAHDNSQCWHHRLINIVVQSTYFMYILCNCLILLLDDEKNAPKWLTVRRLKKKNSWKKKRSKLLSVLNLRAGGNSSKRVKWRI